MKSRDYDNAKGGKEEKEEKEKFVPSVHSERGEKVLKRKGRGGVKGGVDLKSKAIKKLELKGKCQRRGGTGVFIFPIGRKQGEKNSTPRTKRWRGEPSTPGGADQDSINRGERGKRKTWKRNATNYEGKSMTNKMEQRGKRENKTRVKETKGLRGEVELLTKPPLSTKHHSC